MPPEYFLPAWLEEPRTAIDDGQGLSCGCMHVKDVELHLHEEEQDVTAPGWNRLLQLIEDADKDRREVFRPRSDLTLEEYKQIVTLPPSIAKLTSVKELDLYGSSLVRIPPEI